MPERLKESERHDSQRGWFGYELYKHMDQNNDIYLVTADLGYGLFDKIRKNFPERFYNVGASEQAGVGICVGLALEGKIPFFYSITTFLLYRPFETIRNYIDHEQIPVRLVASGRDRDYAHDGFSHDSTDAKRLFFSREMYPFPTPVENGPIFNNIEALWPDTKEEIPDMVERMVREDKPWFISLRR